MSAIDDDFFTPVRSTAPQAQPSRIETVPARIAQSSQVSAITQAVPTRAFSWASVRYIFGSVLQKHSSLEAEQVFSKSAPVQGLPQPWLFLRAFLLLAGSFVVLFSMLKTTHNPNLLPGVILLGAFAAPIGVSLFFLEANTPRNISLYAYAKFFTAGAVMSVAFATVMYTYGTGFIERFGASGAAFIEEPAKLAAVVLLAKGVSGRYAINGLALGAAVGAGFAAFESAGYALTALMESQDLDHMSDVTVLRAWTSVGTHTVWTAILACALWQVMNGRRFEWHMLLSPRFLVPAAIVTGLHFAWNSDTVSEMGNLAYISLITVSLGIAFSYLISEVRFANTDTTNRPTAGVQK